VELTTLMAALAAAFRDGVCLNFRRDLERPVFRVPDHLRARLDAGLATRKPRQAG
jgi:hypothetical protein